jgi:hypothetical protein
MKRLFNYNVLDHIDHYNFRIDHVNIKNYII